MIECVAVDPSPRAIDGRERNERQPEARVALD